MNDMYGLNSDVDYTAMSQMPGDLEWPVDHGQFPALHERIAATFKADSGGCGTFPPSSAVSDAASMVAEIQKGDSEEEVSRATRGKIVSHPLFPRLLELYIDCQQVGAPPEKARALDKIWRESDFSRNTTALTCLGADPELDEFMETYCGLLSKYKSDLATPFDEATTFLKNIRFELNSLCEDFSSSYHSDGAVGSFEENFIGNIEVQKCQQLAKKGELKDKLFQKYSGYISSLKDEFSKKRKKGKLPVEARQTLFDWWNSHFRWPYPTEREKMALAEATELDPKQINNWFINQRKRHWKPCEDMQFSMMDNLYAPFS